MKTKIKLITLAVCLQGSMAFSQLGQFSNALNQYFSAPEESGFMYF